MKTKILLIEDEDSIRKFVKINLERESYNVFEAVSGEEGLEIAKKESPDIVVLDVMLPGIDGFDVCRALRIEFPKIGIIMLTAKAEELDKIMGLQNGSDDYLTKPFNPVELNLRIKSLERRIYNKNIDGNNLIIQIPFKIDTYARKFYKNNIEIELTPTEYQIMKKLMLNPGKALKRDEILKDIWGDDFIGDSKIVDVNIRRLRSKIEENPAKPKFIETIWGMGYRWFIEV